MKAYGYLRVSGGGQINGDGFDRQRDAIQRFANQAGITIPRFYEERGISGTKGEEDRPAFQEMLTDILSNGVRAVVVERLDRLARQYMVQEQLLIYLASKGVTLWNASTGEDITEAVKADPMKKAVIQIQGVFAELEKSLLVKRLKSARQRKRETVGKCEGAKGWNDTAPERKAEIMGRIRRLRRKPKGCTRQMSYQAIADRLNTDEIRTFKGGKWSAQLVRAFNSKSIVKKIPAEGKWKQRQGDGVLL
jgi:DNA invertase Pin-like site-specific DNA recombinase